MSLDALTELLRGVPITLLLTGSALLIGIVGGVPLTLGRLCRFVVVRWASRLVIEFLRGIPPIVWLFIIYFGFGNTFPALSATMAAILGLGLISCGYMAEIYRGGLAAVAKGQWEAAEALGMPRASTMVRIVAPQVVRVSIPAGATYAIGLLKDSSVAFTLGVMEILYFANSQARVTSDALTPFLLAALIYIAMTIPCAWGSRALDARLRRRVH